MAARHGDWLRQADADLRHAGNARDHDTHEWACFAAQQAAEKSLKAVLLSRGEDAWGHTVTALLGLVTTEEHAGEELVTCAKSLDKHYIPTRYPNGFDTGAPVDSRPNTRHGMRRSPPALTSSCLPQALDAVQSSGYGPAHMTDRNDILTIDSTRDVRAWWWPVV